MNTQMLMSIPRIGRRDIRTWVGSAAFERSQRYAAAGAVFECTRFSRTLSARCDGSEIEPYRLQIEFDVRNISHASCSCPAGAEGKCKHIGAVLLHWCERPADFLVKEPIEQTIERLDETTLRSIVLSLAHQSGSAQALVESLVKSAVKRLDQSTVEQPRLQQVAAILRARVREWDGASGACGALREWLAKQPKVEADVIACAESYQSVACAILGRYRHIEDPTGDLGLLVRESIAMMGNCLVYSHKSTDKTVRDRVLHGLFDIFCFDLEFSGKGPGRKVEQIVRMYGDAYDREVLAKLVRSAQKTAEEWATRVYSRWLLSLDETAGNANDFAEQCRALGAYPELVYRLLHEGKTEQAQQELALVPDRDFIMSAEQFSQFDLEAQAEQVVLQRAQRHRDTRLFQWLKTQAKLRGDQQRVLELAVHAFVCKPSLDDYRQLRVMAEEQNCWQTIKPSVLLQLEGQHDVLLADIYMQEQNISAAIAQLRKAQQPVRMGYAAQVRLRVAQVAEPIHKEFAIEWYQQHIELLISARGREHYREACKYIRKVCELLQSQQIANDYVHSLSEKYAELPSLLEELRDQKLAA